VSHEDQQGRTSGYPGLSNGQPEPFFGASEPGIVSGENPDQAMFAL
jgi:hypothetical protein